MAPDEVRRDCYGLTDRGKVRDTNEDQFLVASMHKLMNIEHTSLPNHTQDQLRSGAMARLLLVADGVGGGPAGEEASGLALETVAQYVTTSMRCFYRQERGYDETELVKDLESSVRMSHTTIQLQASQSVEHTGMATTLTLAHVLWPRAHIVQVGDSRCYLFRDGSLRQVTTDQTLAQGLVDEGVMNPDTANDSPLSGVLASAVGNEIFPETFIVQLRLGDVLLLCTDGLTNHVVDETIAEHLCGNQTSEEVCRKLVNTALENGGTDNVTVVVCQIL